MRRTQAPEDQQDLIAFDQPSRLLHSLRRVIAVVISDQSYLATVDTTLLVDHAEIGGLRLANGRVGRSRSTEGHRLTDFDFCIAGSGIIFLLSNRWRCCQDPVC